MIKKLAALAAVSGIALASSSSAHHSTAMFDWGSAVELKDATVLRWEWTNPHTFLYVRAKDASGEEIRWAFEGMSPNHLSRAGWTRRTFMPGEKIDLTYYPLRDDRPGGFNVTVTFGNGKTISQLPQQN